MISLNELSSHEDIFQVFISFSQVKKLNFHELSNLKNVNNQKHLFINIILSKKEIFNYFRVVTFKFRL